MVVAVAPLHPNLARIAARYDEIVGEFNSGRVSALTARDRIEALTARDDSGVEWSINADDGTWRYRTLDGEFRVAEPPMWGMATPTPRDFGSVKGSDVDERIEFHEIDDSRFEGSLTGATRRQTTNPRGASLRVLVPSVVLVLGVLYFILR